MDSCFFLFNIVHPKQGPRATQGREGYWMMCVIWTLEGEVGSEDFKDMVDR